MDAQEQLDRFIDRFAPQVAADGRRAMAWLLPRLPGAHRLVYDNYNALAVAFSSNGRMNGTAMSVAFYPRWVSLFFMHGTALPDRARLLEGAGVHIRHVKLRDMGRLDDPALADLVAVQAAITVPPFVGGEDGPLVIQSVSAKQRSRRP